MNKLYLLFVFLLVIPGVLADEPANLVLNDTGTGIAGDALVREDFGAVNFGSNVELNVSTSDEARRQWTFINFNTTLVQWNNLTGDIEARLRLNETRCFSVDVNDVTAAFGVNSWFDESTLTWNNKPSVNDTSGRLNTQGSGVNCVAGAVKNLNISSWLNELKWLKPNNVSIMLNYSELIADDSDEPTKIMASKEATSNAEYFLNITYNLINISTDIATILEQPEDNQITSNTTRDFICSALDQTTPINLNISNVSFFLWDNAGAISAQTDRDLSSNNATTANETVTVTAISDDTYEWNCLYTNNNSASAFATSNFTVIIDSTTPTVIIDVPGNNQIFLSTSLSINFTASDDNRDSCEYSLNGGTTNVSLDTCSNNTFTGVAGDNTLDIYVDDTAGNRATNQSNFTILESSNFRGDLNILEADETIFSLHIVNGTSNLLRGNLVYNETPIDTTPIITSNGSGVFLNVTLTTPVVNDLVTRFINQSFFWNVTFQRGVENTTVTTTRDNQTVYQKFLGNCETVATSTLNRNFTIRDEVTNTLQTGTFNHIYKPLSFNDVVLRTYNFTDSSQSSSEVCIFPVWANFTADTQVHYSINSSFDERDFLFDALRFSNASIDITLLLLEGGASTDVIINVRDQNDNALEGYGVEAYRFDTGNATFQLVDSGLTDFSGKTLFKLDNSLTYRFIISLDGVEKLRNDNVKIIGAVPELFFVVPIGIDTPIKVIDDSIDIVTSLLFNITGVDNAVNFTWNDSGNKFSQFCLVITNFTSTDSTEIFNACKLSNDDRIGFDMTNFFNSTYLAVSYATSQSGGVRVDLETLEVNLKGLDRLRFYGDESLVNDNLFFAFITVAVIGGIGWTTGNPAVAVFMTIVGVMIVFFMQLTLFSATAVIALAVLGGIVMYALKS